MVVLVEDAAEAVTSMDVQPRKSSWIRDRFGQRGEWSGVRETLVRPVGVVVHLELTERV
jgi:hypothetical protein